MAGAPEFMTVLTTMIDPAELHWILKSLRTEEVS